MAKELDKDAHPKIGATGAGADEYRESGPICATDLEDRLAKQRCPVSLNRPYPGKATK
jgi:hypothetical protein